MGPKEEKSFHDAGGGGETRATAILPILVLLGLLLPISPARAVEEGRTAFQEGVSLFQEGNYRAARHAFDTALEQGLDSASLHHNLGVTYFHLGLLKEAWRAFRTLTRYPADAPLAYYNLGLVAQQRGRPFRAERHFETAYALAGDSGLRHLAARQLSIAATTSPGRRWHGYLSLAAGHDTNVLLQSGSERQNVSQRADSFAELLASGTLQANGTARDGLQLRANAYAMRFTDLSSFDQSFYQAGAELDRNLGAWATDWSATGSAITLAGDLFETLYTLEAEGERPVGRHWELELAQEISRVEGEAPYGPLTGYRLRSDLTTRYDSGALEWELAYRFEHNDRDDDAGTTAANNTYFYSYSPQRHEVELEASYSPAPAWYVEIGAGYRHSRYTDTHRIGTISHRRVDQRYRFTGEVARDLDWWGLRLVADYIRTIKQSNLDGDAFNDPNQPDYNYRSAVYRLGLEHLF